MKENCVKTCKSEAKLNSVGKKKNVYLSVITCVFENRVLFIDSFLFDQSKLKTICCSSSSRKLMISKTRFFKHSCSLCLCKFYSL